MKIFQTFAKYSSKIFAEVLGNCSKILFRILYGILRIILKWNFFRLIWWWVQWKCNACRRAYLALSTRKWQYYLILTSPQHRTRLDISNERENKYFIFSFFLLKRPNGYYYDSVVNHTDLSAHVQIFENMQICMDFWD